MKRILGVLGLIAGLLVGNMATAYAQTFSKITATGGWNLCVDAPGVTTLAAAQALGVTIDGAPATGVTWVGTSTFTAQIPLSQLAASYRTVGQHTVNVAFTSSGGAGVVLADGSTLQPAPSTPLAVNYEIVAAPVTPSPTNPRWIKIAGTIAAIALPVLLAWLAH